MSKTRIIGDIHGDFSAYFEIINGCDRSIQVGDYGVGFVPVPYNEFDASKHQFIRGNHDDPELCKTLPNWIPDGTIKNGVMFIGGAKSVDKEYRIENVSWWSGEELSTEELYNIYDKYVMEKPRVVIAHEFPEFITNYFPVRKWPDKSKTRDAFESMFSVHKPEVWIGGHWHCNFDHTVDNTRFVVLDINSWVDVDLDGDVKSFEKQKKF